MRVRVRQEVQILLQNKAMKRKPRTVADWISLLLFLAVAAGVVWLIASSGPVAAIWPAAK
jgi:hypothetical protein